MYWCVLQILKFLSDISKDSIFLSSIFHYLKPVQIWKLYSLREIKVTQSCDKNYLRLSLSLASQSAVRGIWLNIIYGFIT